MVLLMNKGLFKVEWVQDKVVLLGKGPGDYGVSPKGNKPGRNGAILPEGLPESNCLGNHRGDISMTFGLTMNSHR